MPVFVSNKYLALRFMVYQPGLPFSVEAKSTKISDKKYELLAATQK